MAEKEHIGRRLRVLLMFVVLVSGCGGDGGNDPPPPVDDPPQALIWDEANWDEGVWQ